MDIIIERGCGLDIHKKTIAACIMGIGLKKEIRTYGTMTKDLLRLKGWLKENSVTHVAMESTGIYWKPAFNILEDSFDVVLVNARHVKNVPGSSFIPPIEVRELRDLTRYKRKLIQNVTSEKQRIEKVLEDANIKLFSIASDTFGVSGSKMIEALMKGDLKAEEMADLSRGRLRRRKEEIREALVGNMRENHKFMIKASLEHIKAIEEELSALEERIQEKIERHFKAEYELLKTIPGVKENASVIIAEIGVNMDIFPTEMHLSSWAGMSPGNNESAGKKKPGSTMHGNKSLKSILTEFAWVAAKTEGTYLSAKYRSLAGRRGKK